MGCTLRFRACFGLRDEKSIMILGFLFEDHIGVACGFIKVSSKFKGWV